MALAGASDVVGAAVFLAARAALRRDRGVLGDHTLEVAPEGLIEINVD